MTEQCQLYVEQLYTELILETADQQGASCALLHRECVRNELMVQTPKAQQHHLVQKSQQCDSFLCLRAEYDADRVPCTLLNGVVRLCVRERYSILHRASSCNLHQSARVFSVHHVCSLMDTLPATALKVLGQFLDPDDSHSCRLSYRCLSPVVSIEQSSSHIRVVANSFQHRLQQEQQQEQYQNQQRQRQQQQQQQQQRLQAQQQGEGKAQDQSASGGPGIEAPAADKGDTRGPRISDTFTPRSRTAASLARAAASFGYRQAHVYVDVLQKYQDDTWQQMFGALLSSDSLEMLVIVEYSSTSLSSAAKMALQHRHMEAELATLTPTPTSPTSAAAAAAIEYRYVARTAAAAAAVAASAAAVRRAAAITGHWLPHLAAAYTAAAAGVCDPSLQHLDLQLPAPLPVSLQPMLLQLTGIKTLKLTPTRVWPQPSTGGCHIELSEPLLLPDVAAGLSALRSLESLTCCLSAPYISSVRSQVPTKLQRLSGSVVMSSLTHLSFGTSSKSLQPLMLSAPLVSLHSLKSLTCQPGFYVGVEDAQECMRKQADMTVGSGSSDVGNMPKYQIAPSLTKLVLNAGSIHDHEQLLQLMAGRCIPAVTAAAAVTQLQHLEINSRAAIGRDFLRWGPMDLKDLAHFSGLRYFKTFADGVARVANSAIATQLLGLTILCRPTIMFVDGSNCYSMPIVTSFTSLTSLAIQGPNAVSLNPQKHFKQLCALPNLKHFVFSGKVEDANDCHQEVCKLPNGLQSIILRHHQDPNTFEFGRFVWSKIKFLVETFPSSLTSVKFEGWDFPLLQEVDKEGAETSGLRNIEELSIQFQYLHQASPFLRHCSNLQRLSLKIWDYQTKVISQHTTASNSKGKSSSGSSSGSHNAADLPLLSKLCPNLQELDLKLEKNGPNDSYEYKKISAYFPADDVFILLWPEVTQLRGLRKLSLSCNGVLSHCKTVMPNLSALSSLSRLQHLALQLVVYLGPPTEQCAAGDKTTEAADSAKEQQLNCLEYGYDPDMLLSDDFHSDDWPDWWQEVLTDTEIWLMETISGACCDLRALNIQASAIHAEGCPEFKGVESLCAPMSSWNRKCFCGQLLHSREHMMFMEQELPNCLVLNGKYKVQD